MENGPLFTTANRNLCLLVGVIAATIFNVVTFLAMDHDRYEELHGIVSTYTLGVLIINYGVIIPAVFIVLWLVIIIFKAFVRMIRRIVQKFTPKPQKEGVS